MERILIIGAGGAGKSTLARQLGSLLGLEVIHLDALYWQPGWVETTKTEWQATIRQLIQRPRWVMDGNYGGTLDLRMARADTVIFLDLSRWHCLWRIGRRRWQYAGKTRPDMAAACPEKLDWGFVHWVWSYRERRRPLILEKLAQLRPDQTAIVLESPAAVNQFLQTLQP